MKTMFKLKVYYDAADTWRDPSDIVVKVEKFFETEDSAIKFARKYIEEHFFRKFYYLNDLKLTNGRLKCVDGGSWGYILEIEEIQIEG